MAVVLRNRALAVAASVVAAVLVWFVADPILGTDMTTSQNGQDPMVINAGPVVFISLMSGLLGWASIALLERFTRHGTVIWTAIASVVLLVSFVPVFGLTATTGAKVTLVLLHIAVGAVLIPAFWATARPRTA